MKPHKPGHRLTLAQERLYWNLVKQAVAVYCRENGIERRSSADASKLRHQWHTEALGHDKSMTEFSNADFDRVKAHLMLIAQPDDFDVAMLATQEDTGERNRLLRAVAGHPPKYVGKIVHSVTHGVTSDPAELPTAELRKLVVTLEERRRAWQQKRQQQQMQQQLGEMSISPNPSHSGPSRETDRSGSPGGDAPWYSEAV